MILIQVVILGGGFCGLTVAQYLQKVNNLDVTLVDKKTYFEYTPGIYKLLTCPSYITKIVAPYSSLVDCKVINETVSLVTPAYVETKRNKLTYDFLVVSTGVSYPIFLENTRNVFTVTSGKELLARYREIRLAKKIVVIGGGPIGVEVAAELATATEGKDIVLVHSHERVLERNAHLTSTLAQRFLSQHGVTLYLDEKVVTHEKTAFYTGKGRKIPANLGIWCAGTDYNTSFLQGFPDTVFSSNGGLLVNSHLQLMGYPHIFAGGDITAIPEENTARHALQHAKVIAKNIHQKRSNESLVSYRSIEYPLVISLGSRYGILNYSSVALPGVLPAFIKWSIEKTFLAML